MGESQRPSAEITGWRVEHWIIAIAAFLLSVLVMVQGGLYCDRVGSIPELRLFPPGRITRQVVNNLALARKMDLTTLHKLQKVTDVGGEPQEGNR